jgi:hypothetical protein
VLSCRDISSGRDSSCDIFLRLCFLAALTTPALVRTQLMHPVQASPRDDPQSPRCRARATETSGTQAASEETIFGQELSRDGFAGIIAFQLGSGNGLEITRLSIAGEEISRPGEQCQVEVVAGTPMQARFAGRPNGVSRYEVEIETCPFSLDVLEGAALVTRTPRTEALVQPQTLYRDFSLIDADPGLKAIAVRELPKIEQTISALHAL